MLLMMMIKLSTLKYIFYWKVKHSLKTKLQEILWGLKAVIIALDNWLDLVFDDELRTYKNANFYKESKHSVRDFFEAINGDKTR
jgi:hypothetical protein